jgi:pSer/pThr/pTyr-binding forkhead associated (FHA) protein
VQRYGYAFHGKATEQDPDASETRSVARHWLVALMREIPLTTGVNVVGRDPSVQVWLNAPGVSRRHARITIGEEGGTLEDLRSKNGTRVRGSRVTDPIRLVDGDEISFGSIRVTFRAWTGEEATRTDDDQP